MADARSGAYEYAMAFIAASDRYRQQFLNRWREVAANFSLEPEWQGVARESTPYRQGGPVYRPRRNQIVLKDPETHKVVMTYAAKLVRTVLGDPRGEYVHAKPVGWEDAPKKGPTATRLTRYCFGLPGHFRTFVETIIDMLCYGTSVVENPWMVIEREMPVRSIGEDEFGNVIDQTVRQRLTVYDDVAIRPIDVVDFYPDPSRYRIEEMQGAAKRFKMNAMEANAQAEAGVYVADWVREAIDRGTGDAKPQEPQFRQGLDQPHERQGFQGFREMVGYEYWGQLGERMRLEAENGQMVETDRGVITVLNNVVVRARAYPLNDPHLPFHSFIINPVQGRFYGLSPAEVMRYDQSFADAVKILLAEAIIRQVHPPIAIDADAEVDVAALKAWKADAIVMARGGPNAVGTLKYEANLLQGWNMLSNLKLDMQQSSGGLGGISGEPGPDREAATVGLKRIEMALDRPELAAMILEKECLPPLAQSNLRRYQQFLADDDELKQRIGEQPEPVWIGDIMGDFDVEFTGSRNVMSRQLKLQSVDRVTAMATAIPAFQAMVDWTKFGSWIIGDLLELPEIAAEIGDPRTMMMNMLMMQTLGASGNKGQLPTASEPAGTMPAQAAGGVP